MPQPKRELKLHVDVLTKAEHDLIRRYCKRIAPAAQIATLTPLTRKGKSGAKLFVVSFGAHAESLPFVLKLHDLEEIRKEVEAITSVQTVFEDCLPGFDPEVANPDRIAVLAYRHAGGTTRDAIDATRELKDVAYDHHGIRSPAQLGAILSHLYGHTCLNAHSSATFRTTSMWTEYRRYLRHHRGRALIKSMFGADGETKRFTYLRARILNPLIAVEHGFRTRQRVRLTAIHGDLHPHNIVIDQFNVPRLIDFAWAKPQGHFLKDYVLLEISLRYLNFPPFGNVDEQLRVDEALMDEDGPTALRAMRFSNRAITRAYERQAVMLTAIRGAARRAAGADYDFEEYIAAQFLVLYGLMRYEDYNSPIPLRALGLLAQRLANTKFLPL